MIGSCLCGAVTFNVKFDSLKAYQCHCSLCRKQTGAASSCGTVVHVNKFEWLSGESNISAWVKSTGYTSHFCSSCGSSVPNKFRGNPYYWVPAGLMDSENIEVVANIFVCDVASWSQVSTSINPYETRPEVENLIAQLCGDTYQANQTYGF
ncbi:GFA family protein [Cellvibrio zantedeschiae]|uniref:GFA family protein n=1 Tax=Cellvibrio zantedeschiae TaxID=1237077 RepID=UPI001673D76E|nr:GFA family protein [Cellvibrio zantedeschiae]